LIEQLQLMTVSSCRTAGIWDYAADTRPDHPRDRIEVKTERCTWDDLG